MALVVYDRVQQTGTANTTVSFTLSATVTGYQSFSVVGNGNTTYYAATDASGNWEVGIGTYSTTGPTLTRTTILSSSNSGSAVTFSGTVNVFVTYPSENAVYSSNTPTSGYVLTANASGVAPSWQAAASGVYTRTSFTATAGQTSFTVSYSVGYAQVYLNGVLLNSTDYTASSGTAIVLASAAASGDIVEVVAFNTGGVATLANLSGGSAGVVPYQSSTNVTSFTAVGTSGQVLTSNGTSAPTWTTLTNTGTVTSVSFTGGIISVATATTTPALTVAGTSGGIPYFSSGTTWASSAALASNALVIGGGAGAAPSTLGSTGTTTTVLHGNASGAPTFGAVSLTADVSGTLPIANGGTNATTAAAANANLQGFTTTATAAGTTALTNTSTYYQYFTGTNTQTITLPLNSTIQNGWSFHVVNNSTGNLTVNSNSGALVATIIPQTTAHITCVDATVNTAAAWDYGFTDFGSVTGTGANVLGTSPTISTPAITGGTIDNTVIGGTTAAAGTFTQLTVNGANLNTAISPTGTSTVTISPAGTLTLGTAGASTSILGNISATTSNQTITLSPTGTGTVAISPVGALTINPTAASTINNTSIGATTRSTGAFTTLGANSTVTVQTTTNNQSYTTTGAGTITISSGTAGSIDNMNIGATTAGTGNFTTLAATSTVDTSALARASGLSSNTTVTNTATFTTAGITLANQTAATGTVWRVRAYGQFTAASSGTARTAQIACFWGSTQLVAIAPTVLASTAQTTQWQAEFELVGTSTTAIWTTGQMINKIPSSNANYLGLDQLTPASTTVTSGAQTLDLRVRVSTAIAAESWIIQQVTMERLK